MPTTTREVRPFSLPRRVLSPDGQVLAVPDDWGLLPPGDAALSRRLKEDGPSWTVVELKGRKRFSRGIWAPAARIAALRAERAAEQRDPGYQRKLQAGRQRRAAQQADYAVEFHGAVLAYLDFHPAHRGDAELMARLITDHAVPVGSGTVARTERIPLEARAEAATIAWMRHQTTAYDHMVIPMVKGRRREVRRMLARRSVDLLARYRRGVGAGTAGCPLAQALARHRADDRPLAPGCSEAQSELGF
ncbi:MAG: DUF2293 domain-containing protein [Verrucomicrobiota bacterium]